MNRLPLIVGICLASCVPARKFQDLNAKHKVCAKELAEFKEKSTTYEEENNEMKSQIEQFNKQVGILKSDTSMVGRSLRKKELQYDKITNLYETLLDKYKQNDALNQSESLKLQGELANTQRNLQAKEDELKKLETNLMALKADLESNEKDLKKASAELKQREARVNELQSIIDKKDATLKELQNRVANALLGFKDKGLTVEERNGRIYVSMEAKLLFASGSAKVSTEGKMALVQLATAIETEEDINVLVEGHTDSDKMNGSGKYKDNWDLSVGRSTAVVRIMTENSSINPTRLTAAGRGEFAPVDPADSKEAKAKNRRIEIILIPKLDELFEIISQKE